jgi:hypothetical protein
MKCEPIFQAVESIWPERSAERKAFGAQGRVRSGDGQPAGESRAAVDPGAMKAWTSAWRSTWRTGGRLGLRAERRRAGGRWD